MFVTSILPIDFMSISNTASKRQEARQYLVGERRKKVRERGIQIDRDSKTDR